MLSTFCHHQLPSDRKLRTRQTHGNVNFHQQKVTLRHHRDVGLPNQAGRTGHCCALGMEITDNGEGGGGGRQGGQSTRGAEHISAGKQVKTIRIRPFAAQRMDFSLCHHSPSLGTAPGDSVIG